jgi:uncharacterized protein (DUF2126 family)/transglutaminase-like putative cysteine protease
MSIKVAIHHHTSYRYDRAVGLSPHIFRLKPAVHCRTPILSYSLKIQPEKHFLNWQQDPFGNFQARVVFPEKTTSLTFDVELIADMVIINPFDFFIEPAAEKYPFVYESQLSKELAPYFEITDSGPLFTRYLDELRPQPGIKIIDLLVSLNQAIWKSTKYLVRMEPGVQSCEQTLSLKSGSCRDSGWMLVQLLRHLGFAARFVSGYLIQLKADQKALDGPSGTERDFTDLHAWAEVYIPGAGWIGLDPTSGLFAGEGHIPLCCTPHPSSAAPVTGSTDVCEVKFEFKNEVFRIHEDPRVTRPYSEEQWATMMGLGNLVDKDIKAGDMRLTMGGEPTFVSIDDMEAKEWNTAADGPQKRQLGRQLIGRLLDSFGPGGFLHTGQGKWYPGEPLPRWQYSAWWRKDAAPIWRDRSLLETNSSSDFKVNDAKRFATELTRFLGIDQQFVHPAFEDAFFFLWEEGKVPVNVDPGKANLNDPLERQKLTELLQSGLGEPVGFVIPIEWNYWSDQWLSCEWKFRQGRLILMPGNSSIGLRLPLKSLPVTSALRVPAEVERSPFEELPALLNMHEVAATRYEKPVAVTDPPREFTHRKVKTNGKKDSDKDEVPEEAPLFDVYTVKTAICVEVRQGGIYVFMPPLKYAEHYLDLLASIESAAAKTKVKVVIEGYEPPQDYRLTKLSLSPDPGVLEVNIHPATSWKDLVNNYDTLFEQARLSRLGTEKFMLDGKHTGTGGGNHITIGGITPSDSPLLRRPDLLRSLVTYWQHHPGLSYLFASQFIGPTSQAPRVDEGRMEMLYELEIAFEQIPDGEVPFWLVDRLFRNLLIDITGNTHRAEFCIDKLYSPDGANGRLGLLELRAFDMPPGKELCIAQLLLLRCILAMLWKRPYKRKLVRWGTELYDKFMLPHYVHEDLTSVMDDLRESGYPFQLTWLEPFFEFRFPLVGKVSIGSSELEIRVGLEPWHVLGEESASGRTARFVDSSVERVQLRITNFNPERFVVVCNGSAIPLSPTAVSGEYVAGVRYKAWNPPSALHPTVDANVPLTFNVIDKWNNRTIGGCVYHVSHPGGRNYDTFPVNAFEAEGRRISRFWKEGHKPGPLAPSHVYSTVVRYLEKNQIPVTFDPPPVRIAAEYPHTLDLRQS